MNIPKSPLEVSHIIEKQKQETDLKCSSSIECADCGVTTTDWVTCSKCGRKVCTKHINSSRGICDTCTINLDTENKDYHEEVKLAELQRLARLQQAEADYNIEIQANAKSET